MARERSPPQNQYAARGTAQHLAKIPSLPCWWNSAAVYPSKTRRKRLPYNSRNDHVPLHRPQPRPDWRGCARRHRRSSSGQWFAIAGLWSACLEAAVKESKDRAQCDHQFGAAISGAAHHPESGTSGFAEGWRTVRSGDCPGDSFGQRAGADVDAR